MYGHMGSHSQFIDVFSDKITTTMTPGSITPDRNPPIKFTMSASVHKFNVPSGTERTEKEDLLPTASESKQPHKIKRKFHLHVVRLV